MGSTCVREYTLQQYFPRCCCCYSSLSTTLLLLSFSVVYVPRLSYHNCLRAHTFFPPPVSFLSSTPFYLSISSGPFLVCLFFLSLLITFPLSCLPPLIFLAYLTTSFSLGLQKFFLSLSISFSLPSLLNSTIFSSLSVVVTSLWTWIYTTHTSVGKHSLKKREKRWKRGRMRMSILGT